MTMYTIAGTPVTQDEFARAAQVCLGKPLDKKVVSTVFDIFDVDGEYCRLHVTSNAVKICVRAWNERDHFDSHTNPRKF